MERKTNYMVDFVLEQNENSPVYVELIVGKTQFSTSSKLKKRSQYKMRQARKLVSIFRMETEERSCLHPTYEKKEEENFMNNRRV